jgi:hypothetical protein
MMSLAVTLGLASAASADLVVDWGGNYVSQTDGTQPMQAGGFSAGDPLVISPATKYQGYAGAQSVTIRGQLTASDSDLSLYLVVNDGATDRLQFKTKDGESGAALTLWASDEFIGNPGTAIEFDAASSIDLNILTFVNVSDFRHVIRTAAGYFISEGGVVTGVGAQSSTDLTSLDWFHYDPASNLTGIGAAASIVSGGRITGIVEVGFLTQLAASSGNALRLDSYEVNASYVPEPAAVGLLGIGGLLIAGARRR